MTAEDQSVGVNASPLSGEVYHDPRIGEAKKLLASRLMDYPNVTGVGVGLRMIGEQYLPQECVRVYVKHKVPESELTPIEVLPRTTHGVIVDVVEGEFQLLTDFAPALPYERRVARNFPFVSPGVSVGSSLHPGSGTLGAVVYDAGGGGQQLLLSNDHVLRSWNGASGEAILQPGIWDGGIAPKDTIAVLARYANTERIDAAVAVVNGQRFLSDAIAGIGLITGVGSATYGMQVRKSGLKTGVTTGMIDGVDIDLVVGGIIIKKGQISIAATGGTLFAAGGDSGSLLVDADNRAIGLLFNVTSVGGQIRTYANPISEVINALRIRFTPQPLPVHASGLLAATLP